MDKLKSSNPFPVEVFPVAIQQIIKAVHRHLGYPVDFSSAAILYAASVAVGNTHKVHVKEGFVESAVLYLALVGRAGTNKTHPVKFALKPLRQKDVAAYHTYKAQKQEYDQFVSLSRKERDQQALDGPVKPVWSKTIVGDFTLEALVDVHKGNLRGIGVHADELASWFKNFNRYSQGSEMEFWLSSWSGSDISFDRKSSEPTLIVSPFISVIGTIQPSVLNELAKDSRSQNGFMDRILFVAPDNLQKQPWEDTELPSWIANEWQRVMSNLIERPLHLDDFDTPKPTVLKFSPEAREILFSWQNRLTRECNESSDDTLASIYSKLEVYAVRFALILQMLYYATAEGERSAVDIDAVCGAIKLAEYFKNNALKVRSHVSLPKPLSRLAANRQVLYDSLPETFTTEEAIRVAAEVIEMPERTLKHFLNKETELVERVSQGNYRKLI